MIDVDLVGECGIDQTGHTLTTGQSIVACSGKEYQHQITVTIKVKKKQLRYNPDESIHRAVLISRIFIFSIFIVSTA